jgi:hypothetical protein
MKPSAAHQDPLAAAEVDVVELQACEPRMRMPFGQREKQTLCLDAPTCAQKLLDEMRPQSDEALHDGVDFVHERGAGRRVTQLEHRALRQRHHGCCRSGVDARVPEPLVEQCR